MQRGGKAMKALNAASVIAAIAAPEDRAGP